MEVGVQWVGLSVVGSQFVVIHLWRDWVQNRSPTTGRTLGEGWYSGRDSDDAKPHGASCCCKLEIVSGEDELWLIFRLLIAQLNRSRQVQCIQGCEWSWERLRRTFQDVFVKVRKADASQDCIGLRGLVSELLIGQPMLEPKAIESAAHLQHKKGACIADLNQIPFRKRFRIS